MDLIFKCRLLGDLYLVVDIFLSFFVLQGSDQMQTLLAIGTGFVQGEDVPARGRIILMSLGQGDTGLLVKTKLFYIWMLDAFEV
jgi:hypothetical protein